MHLEQKADIYSLGLILLEIANPMRTSHEKIQGFEGVKKKRNMPDDFN